MRPTWIAIALMPGLIGPALAQRDASPEPFYREEQPATIMPVVEPEPEPVAEPVIDTTPVQRRRPRVLVYWHRSLGDSVSDTVVEEAELTSSGPLLYQNYRQTVRHTFKTGPDEAYSLLPPAAGAEFEAAFHTTLRRNGVRIIDRDMAIRLVGRAASGDGRDAHTLNVQALEMDALVEHADYLAEINFIEDRGSRIGSEPRVKLIDVRTGEIAVDVVPSDLYKNRPKPAAAEQPRSRWVETERGFVRQEIRAEQKAAPTSGDDGRAVALAVLRDLSDQIANAVPRD